jgi:hypothetical protein
MLLAGAVLAAGVAPASASARTVSLTQGRIVYRGTGDRSLGTLRLKHTAKLSWRHGHGGHLELSTSAAHSVRFPLVSTTSRTGSVTLRAGTYNGLRLTTAGAWRLTITTLKRR